MKIAVIYNRDSNSVINLFGIPNRERYGKKSISRIVDSLKKYGHQVKAFEGDKDLIPNLEKFMPRVLKGELPGMAFNLSYGIQGQARYTHVPGILEMVGIPYIGSNPLAHSLALDKVVAKMIFRQNNIPTPDFTVLNGPGFDAPDIEYPLITKPKNEAVSMGIRIVHDENELREAAQVIFDTFNQPVLVEQYIEGREINVGLLGNNQPESLPPCEITFGKGGPPIYTIEDKKGKSGREINWICPAPIPEDLTERACEIALQAFHALGCFDMARVDMRLDEKGNLYVLELNSLPSLGEHGSYTIAANHVGLDFPALVNRMVEVASTRYFGTPSPPDIDKKKRTPEDTVFTFITQRRDLIEKSLENWVSLSSRTADTIGNQLAIEKLGKKMAEIKMKPVLDLCDKRFAFTWETKAGMANGTLLVVHSDVPLDIETATPGFRREPEWLLGEGIGSSRASLVMIEYALRSLRHQRLLQKLPLGVLCYLDEGQDARYSAEIIRLAASRSKRVIVLRPGRTLDRLIVQRRGQRKFRFVVEGKSHRVGKKVSQPEVLLWTFEKLQAISGLSSIKKRVAVSAAELKTKNYPMLLPHHVTTTLLLSYLDTKLGNETETRIREILTGSKFKVSFELISDRLPMKDRKTNAKLAGSLMKLADQWEIPLKRDSSLWPSVGGLVHGKVPVVCGLGPVARDSYTPQECVNRTSLIQRTLILAEFLLKIRQEVKNDQKNKKRN